MLDSPGLVVPPVSEAAMSDYTGQSRVSASLCQCRANQIIDLALKINSNSQTVNFFKTVITSITR